MTNSYNHTDIYTELNINLKQLFCVMAYFEVDADQHTKLFREEDLYYSDEYPWVKGLVLNNNPHVTLLYGLLENVKLEHVESVISGWKPQEFEISHYDYFDSPNSEDYYCIVAKIKLTDNLLEAHQRLSLLPHINTYWEYKPHLTVSYIKKDKNVLNHYLDLLQGIDRYAADCFGNTLGFYDPNLKLSKLIYDNNTKEQTIYLPQNS